MNFKGYKIYETFQSPLDDIFYTKVDDKAWSAAWRNVEDQVWVCCGASNVDDAIYFKLVEYVF